MTTAELPAEELAADERIRKIVARLNESEQRLLETRLRPILRRKAAIARFPTPGYLAQFLKRDVVQTPLLDRLDELAVCVLTGEHRRWLVSCPPQEGKSWRLARDLPLWLLLHNPHLRIAICSYEQGLATMNALAVRQAIEQHGAGYKNQKQPPDREDILGLTLDPDHAQQTNWVLADVPGRRNAGGMVAIGVGSSFTGKPADVIIVDDPYKDPVQADSPAYRSKVQNWWQSVVIPRLAPGGTIVVVHTRWHEDDLIGWLLEEDKHSPLREWRYLNIKAQAEEGDPLGREPGEWLVSARRRTTAEWEAKRRQVGERWWFAQYQGDPHPPEGGLFKRAWFERGRVSKAPEMAALITVVDPADNTGEGDESGIITAGKGYDGELYIVADDSGHYTRDGWARRAFFAMAHHGSHSLRYEQSLSGLKESIKGTWKVVRTQAKALRDAQAKWHEPWPMKPDPVAIEVALTKLVDADDDWQTRARTEEQLYEMWPHVPVLTDWPETGPPVSVFPVRGNKELRASFVTAGYENGSTHHVGRLGALERQMAIWRPGNDSPDRMDAAVHALTILGKVSGPAKVHRPTQQLPARLSIGGGRR